MELITLHRQFRRHCSLEEGLAVRTVGRMKSCFGTFLKRTELEELNHITEEALRGFFYEGRDKYQWSPSHYINHHKYLKKFLDWCVSKDHIVSNPIMGISRPKKPQSISRRLDEEAAGKVLRSSYTYPWRYDFECDRNHAIIVTFLYTGVRLSELLNLEVTDLNLEKGELFVRHGKGDKDRYVPLHFKCIKVLKDYMKSRGTEKKDSKYLFTGVKSNYQLNAKDILRICKKISTFSGVSFTPHPLRHTFGSLAIEQGLPLVQLKEIMGHSSINSTMIYLKMSAKSLKKSLDKLEMF